MLRFDFQGALRTLVTIVITFSVFLSATFSPRRITEIGKHCPTATVQKIVAVVKVKTNCGCVVKEQVLRAPKVGEKGFKQCECAEKKSPKSKTQDQSGEPITWYFSTPFVPEILALKIPCVNERFEEGLHASDSSPQTPPPLTV